MTRHTLADVGGALHLVITDLYDGQHERDDFRVTGSDGTPLRASAFPGAVGLAVEHQWGPVTVEYYARLGGFGNRTRIYIQAEATGPTERTPCPRAVNPRRKCTICKQQEEADDGR